MLSDRRTILKRVRISFDALRLCLLVAAGVTSGYLWRAAFESSTPEVRLAGKPRIVEQAPASPVVRIPPARLTPRASAVAVKHRSVRRSAVLPVQPAHAVLVSRPVAPAPAPAPRPKPKPKPNPAPHPTPAPGPPAPTTTTAAPQPAAPAQAAAAPPAPPPTSPQESSDGTRPGWGKGDKNHDHTGPGSNNP